MSDHLVALESNAGGRLRRRLGRSLPFAILAEFRRALDAARRYEGLRYGCAGRDGLAPADIPRRIFEEFDAHQGDTERAALAPDRGSSRALSGRYGN